MRPIDITNRPTRTDVEAGAAPMLQWLKIADLVIDDRYQRELNRSNWRAIERIAERFTWSKFSPVFCAPVAGGKFAIIDGQHRTHAAALCGFKEVPAQIVQMSEPEQAASFAAVNGDTIRITAWQVYRAALEAGEPWAEQCRDIVEAAGCKLMTLNKATKDRRPGEVYGFRMVREHAEAGRGAGVTRALAAMLKSKAGSAVDAWNDKTLRPWISAVVDRGHVSDENLRAFLDKADLFQIEDTVSRFIRDRRQSGHPVSAKNELLALAVGSAIDKAFPVRMRAAE